MTEENFYQYIDKSQIDLNNIFIEKASYIIKKNIIGQKHKKVLEKKVWAGKIAPGNWFSFTNYLQIKEINGNKITVMN